MRSAFGAIFRFALRDLRGGLRFYGVFIACLVLGVMAIVGVGATSRAFREGLAQQGATLLGGDLSLGPRSRDAGRGRAALSGVAREIEPDRGLARDGADAGMRRRPRWSKSRRSTPPIP